MSIHIEGIFDSHDTEFAALAPTDQLTQLIGRYRAIRAQIERVADFMQAEASAVMTHFSEGNTQRGAYGSTLGVKTLFRSDGAIASLNSCFWSQALNLTNVLELMPSNRKSEWHTQIYEMKTPDFEEETVRSTIFSLLNSREQFFAERVDGVFRSLSRSHVTNQPQGFSKRMILEDVVDKFGTTSSAKEGYVNDLRAVIARILGREEPRVGCTTFALSFAAKRPGIWFVLDGGSIRIKMFKKGTLHLEINPDMAWQLNAVLAKLYPFAIPASHREKPAAPPKSFAVLSTPLPFPVTLALSEALNNSRSGKVIRCNISTMLDNKPLALQITETLATIGGVPIDRYKFEFDYEPQEVLESMVLSGLIPEHRSHQYYPTNESLASEAVNLAEIEDEHSCLEPSAGQGGIARFMPCDQTLCIDISELHTKILKAKGLRARTLDFLHYAACTHDRFDRIVMNPPYSENRASLHVTAASKLLKDKGRLVAIVPASLKDKLSLEGLNIEWSSVREDQFIGTGVRVVLLIATI